MLDFIKLIYKIIGIIFYTKISTGPEMFVDAIETWDNA